ncbi:probable chitinase 10 [Malaya genurostris]|uniref:probable chitinase 10 n=1 Tax=Malaya genurostris TaxID=325434 RepID=UPI0026F39E5B|nr:probable chitinase 10 [Malaya genurostris]XP_058458072.1 probable chitinase 10 [Malaya genurostris]
MKALIIAHFGLLIQLISARFISDNICLAMPNGQKLPVTDDCSSYIVCEYNVQSIRHCASGTLFDPLMQVCNWASMVRCGETPTLPPMWFSTTKSSINTPDPSPPPTNPPQTKSTTKAPTSTIPTTATTRTTLAPTTSSPPSQNPYPQCASDGFYFIPHPSACESYYICAYGMLILHSCGQGVYWNTDTNQCDFPANTNCSNLPNPAKPETSTPSIGTTTASKLPNCRGSEIFHPSIEHCGKYYICIGSSPILMSCPKDYLWNPTISQCDRPENTRCATSFN